MIRLNRIVNLKLSMASDFIYDYFVKPIISPETQGYNLINTATYIIVLVIACFAIYVLLRKKIKFDNKFFTSLLPYILFGISMRVVMHQIEAGILVINGIAKTANPMQLGFWFFTPGVWLLTFALVVIGLIIATGHKKLNTKRFFWFGAIICAPAILFNLSRFNNWGPFLVTVAIIAAVAYGLYLAVDKFTKYKITKDPLNLFIITGQAIDGIASTIAISFFNFSEQHVVSNALINIHPIFFVIAKLAIGVLICWTLDDYLREAEKSKNSAKLEKRKNRIGFIKLIIAILGFATGLASLFKLGLI
jgi:uncharacterized membrane protein